MSKGDCSLASLADREEEAGPASNVVKSAFLRKVKSKRLKWFVLRREDDVLYLDYYRKQPQNNKKGTLPAKSIVLSTAFAIQRKPNLLEEQNRKKQTANAKHALTVYIYTWDTTIGLIFEDEKQLQEWYDVLVQERNSSVSALRARRDERFTLPNYDFDFVWEVQVTIPKNETPSPPVLSDGIYRLCISGKMVYFHKKAELGCSPARAVELHLNYVKKIGHGESNFQLVTGRSSILGACTVQMKTEDKLTATHLHDTIRCSMAPQSQSGQHPQQPQPQQQQQQQQQTPLQNDASSGAGAYLDMDPTNEQVHSGPTLPQECQLISALASQHLSSNPIIQSPSLVNKSSILLELNSSGYVSMAPSSGNTDSPSELLMSPTSSAPSNGPLDSSDPSGYLNMVPTTYLTEGNSEFKLLPVKSFLPSESCSTLTSVHGNHNISFATAMDSASPAVNPRGNTAANLPPNASAASTTSSTSNIASSNSSFMSLVFSSGNQSMAAQSGDHQSSLRQLRSYSYGSRPLSHKGSRTQMRPTRSSILASLFVGDSLSMSDHQPPAETSIRSRAHSTGSHGMKDIKSSILTGVTSNFRIDSDLKEEVAETSASQSSLDENKKCTKSSSVPFLNQPTMRERSSTVGSRPGKKSK